MLTYKIRFYNFESKEIEVATIEAFGIAEAIDTIRFRWNYKIQILAVAIMDEDKFIESIK